MSQHELDYDGSNEPDYVLACSMAIFLAGHPSYSHLDRNRAIDTALMQLDCS